MKQKQFLSKIQFTDFCFILNIYIASGTQPNTVDGMLTMFMRPQIGHGHPFLKNKAQTSYFLFITVSNRM